MNFEGAPQEKKAENAPEEIVAYEKWWKETFGREPSPEEDKQLFELAQSLAQKDETFKKILGESLANEFIGSETGLEDPKKRRWALVGALSTYGKEFGLQVD